MKIKVLGIAPYEGMKNLMERAASHHPNIQLHVYVGNLEEGVAYAKSCYQDFDMILSRGGTAEMIEETLNIPVISIEFSAYDILRAMKLAENYSGHYALVGFSSITQNTQILCELLQYHIDIYTISSLDETKSLLEELSRKNYSMILCDMIMDTLARQYHLNSILITSGMESIDSAFRQLEKTYKLANFQQQPFPFLESLLQGHNLEFMIFNHEMQLVFTSVHTLPPSKIMQIASSIVQKEPFTDQEVTKKSDSFLIRIFCKIISMNGADFYSLQFTFSHIAQSKKTPTGLEFYTRESSIEHFLQHFHGIPLSFQKQAVQTQSVEELINSPYPLLLLGEKGTGKMQIAASLYAKSNLQNNTYLVVDFEKLREKDFQHLLQNPSSPLYSHPIVVHFLGMSGLAEKNFEKLIAFLTDTNFCKRNRTFFSFTTDPHQDSNPRILKLLEQISCITVHLPPLRERTTEISTIASLYINTLNQTLGKQIVGFESSALQRLTDYSWPGNLIQLKRVLTKMVSLSPGPYISEAFVCSSLHEEDSIYHPSADKGLQIPLNLDQPLHDITKDVIQTILSKYNNNQSKTAEHLNISRSTLWRYLKD